MSALNKNNVLGRGMGSLLSNDFDKSILLDESERIQKIDIDSIKPDSNQPRKDFNLDAINDLAQSIKIHGVLQPLIVSQIPGSNDQYTIIAGERRWRASKLAKLKVIPVIVRNEKDDTKLEIALIESIQRVDLTPMELAYSINELHEKFNITYDEVGKRIGKSGKTVANNVRLINLPKEAIDALNNNKISEGHARTILSLSNNKTAQTELLNSIIKNNWSVRQAERWVVAYKKLGVDNKTAHERVRTENPYTKKLGKKINAPVSIKRTAKGGRLEISFKDEDDLQRIITQLG